MDRILRLSLDNSVFVYLTAITILVTGVAAAMFLPREIFPEVSLDRVSVVTALPGATAQDVEELVTKPIEDALEDVADVDNVQSRSQEGSSLVTITFLDGVDLQSARSEVEKAVSSVDTLPDDADVPVVKELKLELPVVAVALLGDPGATRVVEDVADELRKLQGVSMVTIAGQSERKIFVDLDERKVRALGLAASEVAAAIRTAHANVPAGTVELDGQDIFVKTQKRLGSAADVARIPLAPGSALRIGDVARVKDVPDPGDTRVWVDGQPAVQLIIGRESTADPLTIRDEIFAAMPRLASRVPPGMVLVVADDYTSVIRERLRVVGINAIGGGVLVVLVLFVMSGLRQAILAAVGMGVSFPIAFLLMKVADLSINVVSTFGLLIAIGIVVDDAIVVIENVQRHLEMGKSRRRATTDGAREVLLPVTVAVITTCLAFFPLTQVSGTMGRVMKILPLVVIFCLLGSLFEALFLLPGHLSHFAKADAHDGRTVRLVRRMKRIYRVPLTVCTRHRYLTGIVVTLAFGATVALAARMPFQVNAPAKPFQLQVHYEVMPGLDRSFTRAQGEAIDALVREHLGDAVRSSTLRVGSYVDQQTGLMSQGANLGKLRWELEVDDAVLAAYPKMVRDLRWMLATNPELGNHTVQEEAAGPPAGAGVTAKLRGRDIAQLNRAVAELKAVLYGIEGVSDLRDDYGAGKETFVVEVDQDRAARVGLTELEVANAARAAIDGITALEVSIDEQQVDIVVRIEGAESRGRQRLADLLIAIPGGGAVRLDQIARISRTREAGFINREDGFRTVRVLGEIDTEVRGPLEVAAEVQQRWDSELVDRFDGVTLTFGGEVDELLKSLDDLFWLFPLAIAMIYFVLALQFKSYLQPLIILTAVPFGLMGAVLGLASMGYDLSIFAMFGMVALAGIVVNDSLVMIDFINKNRAAGMDPLEATLDGALNRLRPILSTTLTTSLGLLPMAIGLGGHDAVLGPMAVAISAGLMVATILVLLVVPATYLIVDDVRRRLAGAGP
jgi:multidrug efflux pump subunit AcrB